MICEKPLLNTKTVSVKLKRGLDNIIAASIERQDGKVSLFQQTTSIELQ